MSRDRLEQLRAKLAGLRGPSRVGPLLEITTELVDRHWQVGPDLPEAPVLLTEAIGTAEEAYGYLDAGDPGRRQSAAQLGTLLGTRHLIHGSPDDDRVRAIALLEDGIGAPRLAPSLRVMGRLTLGQLHLITTARALNGANLAAPTAGSALPPTAEADVDRAIRCFGEVLDLPAVSAEGRYAAESLRTVAEALGTIVAAVRGGLSQENMSQFFAATMVFQQFHEEQSARAGRGFTGGVVSLYDAGRPAMTMDAEPATPRPGLDRPARATDRVAAMRDRLRDLIAGGVELFTAIEGLLVPGARPLPADEVDEIVALAGAVVDSGRANRTDHLLYALGLLFRARTQGSPAGRLDVEDAADHLLRAAGSIRPAPSEVVRIMRDLAAALDRLQPGIGVTERLTSILADV
ncbi:hypothetical protein ODJ79_34625 [Actinoplanes sp. KI2]|uniref:hypothetical protein n=1 Tax=Actinoplanes sp. KI2 TaxID=2983315 RepID=UPI0021D5A8BF|nr:hypothetical protein [Actinoplanes sp. KI2]MCU7728876.1 hypothetical protein [Actinoplanes sp. KI2]